MISVFIRYRRGENLEKEKDGDRDEAGGRDWSGDVATSQGVPGATRIWKTQVRALP